MNYRMQLSPLSGIRPPAADAYRIQSPESLSANLDDATFVRSWLIYDSDLELDTPTGHVNWSMVLGLVVAAVVSASFWIGAGVLIARLWK
jgi:hypothetical protein